MIPNNRLNRMVVLILYCSPASSSYVLGNPYIFVIFSYGRRRPKVNHSFPGTYTSSKTSLCFGWFCSKIVIEDRTLYKVFSVRLTPPMIIPADISDCKETALNVSSREGRVYESVQGISRNLFQGYLEEGLLEPFLDSNPQAYFVTQVGKPRIEYKYSFDIPGVHAVKMPASAHNVRSVVVGDVEGGGGAGGIAFGGVAVKSERS
ncbi:hypothetical protein Gasu2_07110 [Galdieria sulphuraria]|uniref:Uncharacterized protein n=1 Tax=Galdieria sulphuraria TaxID=130081 RepID=M2X138_GALSU|nr:uncharacterized protein Gasu_26620 [Galdieria sulphuraria]EME30080.1 hypothetical protein Gasu_26620 [Galdieria sulphuraria]GJD06286.1 hypothetical protein Gasu2_07110 [Galdieria sulphuraria]|eukprot:XP_005706600.1 hypothetical protein Gasu_26620 [Galdieria sulphuraria]